jgi:hypothetical protein
MRFYRVVPLWVSVKIKKIGEITAILKGIKIRKQKELLT